MYPPHQHNDAGAEAGPSRPRPGPPAQKRRRLQFTSQLRSSIQRFNDDGTETVEYLHHQSTQRLKRKWDSIFERFKDAHLQDQDEIYLGNRANGEPIVVVKDRGSLRSLRQSMDFGVFIKDEELQGWKQRPEARDLEGQDDADEDDIDPSHAPLHPRHPRHLDGIDDVESDGELQDDPAANDPDLREFLQAEARRKALLGNAAHADDEDDDVIDFGDPSWNLPERMAASAAMPPPPPPRPRSRPTVRVKAETPTTLQLQPELVASSSEDEDDADIVTVHSDSDEELVDSIRTKRQNIEELIQCTNPFETLPYNDIIGLASLLAISDKSSRLYVDLVSEDEDEDQPDETAELSLPHEDTAEQTSHRGYTSMSGSRPSALVVGPASSQRFEAEASQASSALASQPTAPAVPSLSPQSRTPQRVRIKQEPSATPEKRFSQRSFPATPVSQRRDAAGPASLPQQLALDPVSPARQGGIAGIHETPVHATPVRKTSAQAVPTSTSMSSTLARFASPAQRVGPAVSASARVGIEAIEPTQVHVTPVIRSTAQVRATSRSTSPVQRVEPAAIRPATEGMADASVWVGIRATPVREPRSTARPKSATRPSARTPTSKATGSSVSRSRSDKARRRRSMRLDSSSESDDPDALPSCGGPGRCTKTFCLHCVSLSRPRPAS